MTKGNEMEPTPPAAAVTSSVPFCSEAHVCRPIRSNMPSQAVSEANGSAAASVKESVASLWPTSLSSTAWKLELAPGWSTAPA